MKAIVLEKLGPPEVMIERELTPPVLQPHEIRVGVRASGVNFADLLQRLGLYGNAPRLPYVPGFEVAGEVIDTGAEASRFRRGDRVVALTRFGGYGEEVCVPQEEAFSIPEGMTFEQAAALPVNFLTAWFCIHVLGRLAENESVLIQGGAGGVGTAAVQLARATGARIFSTAGSAEKVAYLKSLGVDHPIDYTRSDFAEEVRQITNGRGVDLVLDAVGGQTLRKGYQLLAPLGRLVSYGLSAAAPSPRKNRLKTLLAWWQTPRFDPLDLIGRNVGVFGFHLGLLNGREEEVANAFRSILERTEKGELQPVIAACFPLTRQGAVEAHHYLHARRNIGKVLLTKEMD